MAVTDEDLAADALGPALGGRPFRTYPALLSTEADAMAWARAGGPHGGVVTAGYQAAPRGRAGFPWKIPEEGALAFSMLVRPGLSDEREGFLYLVGVAALAEHYGDGSTVSWPDEVHRDRASGYVGVQTDVGPNRVNWGVLSLLATGVARPRGPVLARLADAVERLLRDPPENVVAAVSDRCTTIGRRVRTRLIPLGPRGVVVEGTARAVNDEGSLVVETETGRLQPVRPQDLGVLEDA